MVKLSELSRAQLEVTAKKYAVQYNRGTTDKGLRKAIREAKVKKGQAVAEKGPSTSQGGWPKDWSAEKRAEYYQKIVGKPLQGNTLNAYRELIAAIEAQIPKVQLRQLPDGEYDCLGVYYSADRQACESYCEEMPLCKAVCKKRPELLSQLKAINEAIGEAESMAKKDLQASKTLLKTKKQQKKVGAQKTNKKTKIKPSASSAYKWTGVLRKYKFDDGDLRKVYKWISEQSFFTLTDLAVKLDSYDYENSEEFAEKTIEFLITDKALTLVSKP